MIKYLIYILLLFPVTSYSQLGMFLRSSLTETDAILNDHETGITAAYALDELFFDSYADNPPTDNVPSSTTNDGITARPWTVTLRRGDGVLRSFTYDEVLGETVVETWANASAGAKNSFVYRIWDQSGNSSHLEQTNPSYQPAFTDANGEVLKDSETDNKIYAKFDGTDDLMESLGGAFEMGITGDMALFAVFKLQFENGQLNSVFDGRTPDRIALVKPSTGSQQYSVFTGNTFVSTGITPGVPDIVFSLLRYGSPETVEAYINTVLRATTSGNNNWERLVLGASNVNSNFADMKFECFLVYNEDKSSSRSSIEQILINNYN